MKIVQYICIIPSLKNVRYIPSVLCSKRYKVLHILALMVFFSNPAYSACSGCNQTVELNIKQQLSSSGNVTGHVYESSSFSIPSVNTGAGLNYYSDSFSDINGNVPPLGTDSTLRTFQRIDDYFSVAIQVKGPCGIQYAPYNTRALSINTCQPGKTSGVASSRVFNTYIRLDRPLVGGTYAKKIFVGKQGWCAGAGCQSPTFIAANVYLNYNITVPQNCVINAGEVVSVDFGNIPSTAFKVPGQIAERVTPVTRQLTMQCTNIEPFRNMSVRVQANSVSGNAIVSDNKDVGFVLGDSNRRELTPNQPTSTIPFTLSGSNTAFVPVTIWPVSVTGKTPAEGRVSAIGLLRVDFD